MANSFREYAQYYDLLYRDKDYRAEADFVARLLRKVQADAAHPPVDILDLACGTGRHSQELAGMGYRMEGSDLSAEMVAVAREAAENLCLPIVYHTESFQTCGRIGRQFDAVIAMFAAIDYLTDYRDLAASLRSIRGLIREGGVFVFDFWNGNAVVADYSPQRTKRAESGALRIVRESNTTLDKLAQVATVRFDFHLSNADKVVGEFSETHKVRYFYPQEMADFLAANGFELIHRCPFLHEDSAPTADDWNLTYVARPCA